jgi:hypothetical protein
VVPHHTATLALEALGVGEELARLLERFKTEVEIVQQVFH